MRMVSRAWRSVRSSGIVIGLTLVLACAPAGGSTSKESSTAPASKPVEASKPAAADSPGTSASPGAVAKPTSEISIKVGLAGVASSTYAYVHAAQDRGFYAQNGLKADITNYNSGSAAQEALAAGDADFIHYFPPGVATAVSKGVKEKIIATDQFKPSEWHIAVAAGSPFQKVEDLNGKRIGVTAKGSTSDFFALWLAQTKNLKIEVVPIGSAATYPSVISGQIEAAVITPPLIFQGLDKGEVRSVFDFATEMPPNLPSVIVASDKIITANPEAVQRYLTSVFASIRYMKQNADYCASFIAKETNQEQAIAARACSKVISGYSDDGKIQPEWLTNSLDLARLGGLSDVPPTEQFFTDRFTPAKLN